MYIWIDESYDENYFVIAALITSTNNSNLVNKLHSELINKIQNYNNRVKKTAQKIFINAELHETILYQKNEVKVMEKVKKWIFESLASHKDFTIKINSVSNTKGKFDETVYINLIKGIVDKLNTANLPVCIIMDSFDPKRIARLKKSFEKILPDNFQFTFKNSQAEKGIQFADIIAGTYRRYLNKDEQNQSSAELLFNLFSV